MKKKISFIFIVILGLVITFSVYAAISISIHETRNVLSSELSLNLDSSDKNYETLSYTLTANEETTKTFTISNSGKEACNFDLFVKATKNIKLTVGSNTKQESLIIKDILDEALEVDLTSEISLTLKNEGTTTLSFELHVIVNPSVDSSISNYYVDSLYDLKTIMNLYSLNNSNETELGFLNLYFVNDLVLDSDLTINIGCNIHLLWNDINTNGYSLKIIHHFNGVYNLDSITGHINNNDGMFIVNTPKSFLIGQTSSLIENPTNVSIVSTVDLTNDDFKTILLTEALTYFESLLNYSYTNNGKIYYSTTQDLILPNKYFNYDLTYNYTSSDEESLTTNGHVTRKSDDSVINLGITTAYDGKSITKDINMIVVGESYQAVFNHSVLYIKNYLNNICDDGYLYGSAALLETTPYNVEFTYSLDDNRYLSLDNEGLKVLASPYSDKKYNLTISSTMGGINYSDVIEISLKGLTSEERSRHFINHLTDIYVTNTTPKEVISQTLLDEFDLSIENISYVINYYEMIDGVKTLNNSNNNYKLFSITDNILTLKSITGLVMRDTDSVEIEATITWSDSTTISTTLPLLIPETGATGDGSAEAINNLLKSIFNNKETLNTFSDISGNIQNMSIVLSIINTSISDYCYLEVIEGAIDSYRIVIVPENVPNYSTTVEILCRVTVSQTEFVDQYYTFLIPGVYQKNQFETDGLYDFLLEKYGSVYDEGDLRNNYLLVSEAQKSVVEIDFREANLSSLILTGIDYLINTNSMIFDGIQIIGTNNTSGNPKLLPFQSLYNLQSLSMKNCGIETADLRTSDNNIMYNLINLTSLDFSNDNSNTVRNNITSLMYNDNESYFYRSLNYLNLSNQTSLSDITGIENLNNISELHLENNHILYFDSLIGLSNLNSAYIYGNTTFENVIEIDGISDYSNIYGSLGSVNYGTIVSLVNDGIMVYALSSSETTSLDTFNQMNQDEIQLALAINSIIYMDHYFDKGETGVYTITDFKKTLVSNSYTYNIDIVASNETYSVGSNNVITIGAPYSSLSTIELIISLSMNNYTVYRHIVIEKGVI